MLTSTSVFGDWRISTHRAIIWQSLWTSWKCWRAGRFVWFWAFGEAKFTKMGDSLPRPPMNRGAKFDAASFILGGEIRSLTKKTNTQTVTDISTTCLSACVDNKWRDQRGRIVESLTAWRRHERLYRRSAVLRGGSAVGRWTCDWQVQFRPVRFYVT